MTKAEYKKLQKKWYKKLKETKSSEYPNGFNDIERNEDLLKDWALKFGDDRRLGNTSQITRDAKQQYYQLANQFLNEHAFDSNKEKTIWEYHSNGLSIRNIVKTLKKVRIRTHKNAVHAIIAKLRKIMKQKYMVLSE